MKKYLQSPTITTGLAIFAMLFGAGNLIFPLKSGVVAGNQTWIALIGFSITAILLPLVGLIGMVFFDGNYREFFDRLGKIPGRLMVLACMLIIGPLLVMPRIEALTYKLMEPFIGTTLSSLQFSILFALLTFICCFKKESIVNLLGKILSPLKLITLFSIIAIGFYTYQTPEVVSTAWYTTFMNNFISGYQTLDLLAMLFFSYIIISILKKTLPSETANNQKALAKIMINGGLIGGLLLGLVYIGMAFVGSFHGQGIDHSLGEGEIFKIILMKVLGSNGALFIGITVLIACLSTMIALASVVSEYLHHDIVKRKLSYTTLLAIVTATTAFVAQFDIDKLLYYSAPLIFIIYPAITVLTFCNIAYKLWGTKTVKLPVIIASLISTYIYGPEFIKRISKPSTTQQVEQAAQAPVAEL